jgi:hypothetical protein
MGLHHSDLGRQYASGQFQWLLAGLQESRRAS